MQPTSRIHPTAIVAPAAELSRDVEVGPYCVIEGMVRVGARCVLRPHAHLVGPTKLGNDNLVHGGAVLGEAPQHLKYRGEPTALEIGDGNLFSERVTIHRSITPGVPTRVGHRNVFLPGSHVGHDSQVGDGCTFSDNALVAGHCLIEDGVHLGGDAAVHQFCRMGRLSVLEPTSIVTKDVPPFIVQHGVNTAVGVNAPAMRLAGLSEQQIDAVYRAYDIVYLGGLTVPLALRELQERLGEWDVVREFIAFVQASSRGICTLGNRPSRNAA